ncbi:T9SS type A sorting domain-containing protein [bacterium]|nr:T9SS type A sorting domain-containing protein [bacterium]
MKSRSQINPSAMLSAVILCMVFTWEFSNAADYDKNYQAAPRAEYQREVPNDPHILPDPEQLRYSPAYRETRSEIFTRQVNVTPFGSNIIGDAANEPSIAVDPTNPDTIAIGWRQFDTISSDFRQAGYSYSADGGEHWTFPGVLEPGIFRSDPVLDSDAEGVFYYNSLTYDAGDFICSVFRSNDGGATWDAGTFAQGGDKQWMIIDKTGGMGHGYIYAFWTLYWSYCEPGHFTRSVNGGNSYPNCDLISGIPYWGTLAVGPEGELYIGGVSSINGSYVVSRSMTAQDTLEALDWDLSTFVDLGGSAVISAGPNPGGLLGQTWIATDNSQDSTRGNVYLLASVAADDDPDPMNVNLIRSEDNGLTWSDPIRVNDDPVESNAWQWFGTMSVAPTGRIDVVWLDTRDEPGTYLSSLYYANSTDGGDTWSENERLSESFDPHLGWPQQQKMGDYFHSVSDSFGMHLAWAATFNGEQDVYYSYITVNPEVGISDQPAGMAMSTEFSLEQNYPNPFNPSTRIQYNLPKAAQVSLIIYDIHGRSVAKLLETYQHQGAYERHWNGADDSGNQVGAGVYFASLQTGESMRTIKMIYMK